MLPFAKESADNDKILIYETCFEASDRSHIEEHITKSSLLQDNSRRSDTERKAPVKQQQQ